MATNEYYNEDVQDCGSNRFCKLQAGTTNYAGEGPQMYIRLNGQDVILSHEDARAFSEAVGNIGRYLGLSR